MEREKIKYNMNNRVVEATLFKKGDRVRMIVDVDWIGEAKEKRGERWLAESLELINP